MSKRALITGCAGQDGTYLAKYLLSLGYEVFGLVHRTPCLTEGVIPLYGDVRDKLSLEIAFRKSNPDEVYNLAAQVFVPAGWAEPEETFNINVGGLTRLIDVALRVKPQVKIYQASSSEMFGQRTEKCNEQSEMNPVSPYGVSKLAAHKLARVYRQKGLFVASGILFNHESPLRGPEMVTRKISKHVAKWAVTGNQDPLVLGDLSSSRDWGFAGDYVQAMHAMLQLTDPQDFVVGTGEIHTVAEFVGCAVEAAGVSEVKYKVISSPEFQRPGEIQRMQADYTKAETILGWKPKTSFKELVQMMVRADIEQLKKERRNE